MDMPTQLPSVSIECSMVSDLWSVISDHWEERSDRAFSQTAAEGLLSSSPGPKVSSQKTYGRGRYWPLAKPSPSGLPVSRHLTLSLGFTDPVQNVVQVLEKQYLEEKRSALEEQRLMYERELEQLRQQLSPERQSQNSGADRLTYSQTAQQKVTLWAEER